MNQNCKKVQSYNILGLNELNESLFDIITNVSCSVFFFVFREILALWWWAILDYQEQVTSSLLLLLLLLLVGCLNNKSCLLQIVEKMVSVVQNAVLTSCMFALYVHMYCKHWQISHNFRINSYLHSAIKLFTVSPMVVHLDRNQSTTSEKIACVILE